VPSARQPVGDESPDVDVVFHDEDA